MGPGNAFFVVSKITPPYLIVDFTSPKLPHLCVQNYPTIFGFQKSLDFEYTVLWINLKTTWGVDISNNKLYN